MKYNKVFLIVLFFLFFSFINAKALENKIELKIDNEIITTIDIVNEINYLNVLNVNFNMMDYNQKYAAAKESLIREKIKKIEINKFNNQNLKSSILRELLEKTYKNNGFETLKSFEKHLNSNSLTLETIKQKITIEALWNQIIFSKFSSQIKIEEDKIKNEVLQNVNNKSIFYNLSEILINIENLKDKSEKIDLIKEEINKKGFENAALLYSASETSKLGGKIGWVNLNTINQTIKNSLLDLKIGDTTDAIFFSTGFIILKINDIKQEEIKINLDEEVQKLINVKKNQQLNQFSIIYFKKLRKNLKINEI